MDNQTVENIVERVQILENSNIDWVALWIGISSIIVAAISVIVTVILNNKNNKHTEILRKEGNFNNINNHIDTAKMNAQSIAMQIVSIADSPENEEIKKRQIDASVELFLNAYENACDAFYKNKINKQDFIDKYDNDIRKYIEEYKEKFAPPLCMYKQMLRYFEEYHKNKTVKMSNGA
jgi:hypothetical protein